MSAPGGSLTRHLVVTAQRAYDAGYDRRGRSVVDEALHRLESLCESQPHADMATWAQRIAAPGGSTAMLGTGQRASTCAALQWNAERCEREGLGRSCRLTLVGLVAGAQANASAVRLRSSVRAGLAVAEALDATLAQVHRPLGVPGTDVVASATTVALLAGVRTGDLPLVLDLAGSLMTIGAPSPDVGARDLAAGHAAAAGWLAVQAAGAGLLGVDEGVARTIALVTGAEGVEVPAWDPAWDPAPDPSSEPARAGVATDSSPAETADVRSLLGRLH